MHNNVLPPEVKQDLRKEYRLRLITIGVAGLAIVGVLLFLALLPAFITVSAKENQVQNELAAIQKLKQDTSSSEVAAELTTTKQKIDALSAPTPARTGSDIVKSIVKAVPAGVIVKSILYEPSGKGHHVVVNGTASTRDALLAFQSALEHTTPFQHANIPVDELAKSTNVQFTIEVNGDF